MKTFAAGVALLCALFTSACATNPATVEITPQSTDGLIMMLVEPVPADYTIDMLRYNAERNALEANTFAGIHPFMVDAGTQRQFLFKRAKPGRYMLTAVGMQAHWAVCFNENTRAFDLRAGEVAFLGRFDPRVHLLQVQELAISSGRTMASTSSIIHFFEGVNPPALRAPTEAELAYAQTWMTANAPGVTSPVRAVQTEAAQFGIGRGPYDSSPTCGGYFERPIAE